MVNRLADQPCYTSLCHYVNRVNASVKEDVDWRPNRNRVPNTKILVFLALEG
jgi:hypothetical protein